MTNKEKLQKEKALSQWRRRLRPGDKVLVAGYRNYLPSEIYCLYRQSVTLLSDVDGFFHWPFEDLFPPRSQKSKK